MRCATTPFEEPTDSPPLRSSGEATPQTTGGVTSPLVAEAEVWQPPAADAAASAEAVGCRTWDDRVERLLVVSWPGLSSNGCCWTGATPSPLKLKKGKARR